VRLLELAVEKLCGVPDGTYSFTQANGSPRDVVLLTGDAGRALLETIAALLDGARAPGPAPHHLAWWGGRRGPAEARLRARWALSEGEAARVGAPRGVFASEWRFGPFDDHPREVDVEGAPSRRARADLARYVFIDANQSAVWMGGPEADPLAEALTGIVRRDVAGTRVCCREGVGIVGWSTPDAFAALNLAIAGVFPALRIERVARAPGEAPVACFRGGEQVELDQLAAAERDAIHIAAALHAARVRGGVILVDRPELHVPRDARTRWLDWLAGLAATNQLFVSTCPPKVLQAQSGGEGS